MKNLDPNDPANAEARRKAWEAALGVKAEPPPPRPHLDHPWNKLPTEGDRPYIPPKEKGNPEVVMGVDSGGNHGAVDHQGNIWKPAEDKHAGDHWDVQHDGGKSHTNVYPDGMVHQGKDNFPGKKPEEKKED